MKLIKPTLQIVIKHLKVSLFERFLRGVHFLCSLTFTFMHLADTFIQSDLQSIQVNSRTHNLCAANAML